MNREHIEAWVSALESGEYEQTVESLREPIDHPVMPTRWAYCALGIGQLVAEQHGVNVTTVDWCIQIMSFDVREWYGIEDGDPLVSLDGREDFSISALNDTGTSFWDIAQAMRAKYLKENT